MEDGGKAPVWFKRRMLLSVLLCVVCLLIGTVGFLYYGDQVMLILSAAVCALGVFKAWTAFRIIATEDYDTVEGICIGIKPKPLRRYRQIQIIDDEGNESTLYLGKRLKLQIGCRYRFFFKRGDRQITGSDHLDTLLALNLFLGYEEVP